MHEPGCDRTSQQKQATAVVRELLVHKRCKRTFRCARARGDGITTGGTNGRPLERAHRGLQIPAASCRCQHIARKPRRAAGGDGLEEQGRPGGGKRDHGERECRRGRVCGGARCGSGLPAAIAFAVQSRPGGRSHQVIRHRRRTSPRAQAPHVDAEVREYPAARRRAEIRSQQSGRSSWKNCIVHV